MMSRLSSITANKSSQFVLDSSLKYAHTYCSTFLPTANPMSVKFREEKPSHPNCRKLASIS